VSIVAADIIGDIALVIVISALLSSVARRCGQPAVIGQILTGLILGPILGACVADGAGNGCDAARVSWSCGLEPRESAMIAVLVNTRGLTELIALNVRPAADGAPPGPRAATGRYRAAYE
jgi:hypothetical protein